MRRLAWVLIKLAKLNYCRVFDKSAVVQNVLCNNNSFGYHDVIYLNLDDGEHGFLCGLSLTDIIEIMNNNDWALFCRE